MIRAMLVVGIQTVLLTHVDAVMARMLMAGMLMNTNLWVMMLLSMWQKQCGCCL